MSKTKRKRASKQDYQPDAAPSKVWNRSSAPTPQEFAFEIAFVQFFINRFYRWLGSAFTGDQIIQNREALAEITDRLAANLTKWAREVITIRDRERS